MDFFNFTGESPSDFQNLRLPTLDCEIFVEKGQILHSFFEKPMRAGKCLDAKTALPEISVKSSLRQEIICRLTNMHLCLPLSEKIYVMDNFYDKLRLSGYSHDFTRLIFVEALLKFGQMVKNSKLSPSHQKYKPLYLANNYDAVNRGIRQYLRKFDWYDPDKSEVDFSWKKEILTFLKSPKRRVLGPKKELDPPTSVLFVPNSNGGL